MNSFKFFRRNEYVGTELSNGFILPIVRRFVRVAIGQDLVSVQPMNPPQGILYYMDFKISVTQFKFLRGYGAF